EKVMTALLKLLEAHEKSGVRLAAAKALAGIASRQGFDKSQLAKLEEIIRQEKDELIQAAAGAAWSEHLVEQTRKNQGETKVYVILLNDLAGDKAKDDALYRAGVAEALALWYEAGRPQQSTEPDTGAAAATLAPDSRHRQAKEEHDELNKELETRTAN